MVTESTYTFQSVKLLLNVMNLDIVKCQKYIEEKLGCKIIRHNPDAEGFNLFKVINQIFLVIQQT